MATGSYAPDSSAVEPIAQVGDRPEGEQPEELVVAGASGGSLFDALQAQFGSTPWWVISAITHAVMFLLIAFLSVTVAPPATDETVILSAPPPAMKKDAYNETLKRDLFKREGALMRDKTIDSPMIVHDPVPDDHFETDNNMDKGTARGQEDAISDVPLGGTGAVASMGVGGGGMAGCFGYRDGGGRKKATARWGGNPGSESAVEASLRWLKRHQDADGHWDAKKWEGSMKTDPGVTGLALLAFLGAGYTENEGQYKDVVRKATQWIISKQAANGAIGDGYEGGENNGIGYHHAICGLALAEAYGMTKNAALAGPAQKAVDYSTKEHQIPGSGWRYTPKAAWDDPAGTADLSVTGWFVMQLKSAKIAGLNVPTTGFQGALAFLDQVGDQYGRCRYQPSWLSPSPTMTSVGMLCRLFTGSAPNDPRVTGGAEYLTKTLPDWGENGCHVNMYYWYYATLTIFQVQGEPWKKWNAAMLPTLCDNQRKADKDHPMDGTEKDTDGSWDPVCAWGAKGGRAYATAIGALCLEVSTATCPCTSSSCLAKEIRHGHFNRPSFRDRGSSAAAAGRTGAGGGRARARRGRLGHPARAPRRLAALVGDLGGDPRRALPDDRALGHHRGLAGGRRGDHLHGCRQAEAAGV
jgi:hypothetical protein